LGLVQLRSEFQENPVADEVSALTAVVRPILMGTLYALKKEVVEEAGGYDAVKLHMLARLRRPGDGDAGVCFEYAVHDAVATQNPLVMERVSDALAMCKVPGNTVSSILFGAEKLGSLNLINTADELLTPESVLLYGTKGRPVKLKRHIANVAAAFRKPTARSSLPQSIGGLWKADLFTGCSDSDKWIGTTLKINRNDLEGAKGLRLGIVPAQQGESDDVVRNDARNLVVCPLPYDHSFMQVFYQAWEVVVQFLEADARVPKPVSLPRPPSRQAAQLLEDRREFAVVDVIEALSPLAQPELLRTEESQASVKETRKAQTTTTSALLAPIARENKGPAITTVPGRELRKWLSRKLTEILDRSGHEVERFRRELEVAEFEADSFRFVVRGLSDIGYAVRALRDSCMENRNWPAYFSLAKQIHEEFDRFLTRAHRIAEGKDVPFAVRRRNPTLRDVRVALIKEVDRFSRKLKDLKDASCMLDI